MAVKGSNGQTMCVCIVYPVLVALPGWDHRLIKTQVAEEFPPTHLSALCISHTSCCSDKMAWQRQHKEGMDSFGSWFGDTVH